jgi:curli biogenesis system outer membrane secretion channel CsgG
VEESRSGEVSFELWTVLLISSAFKKKVRSAGMYLEGVMKRYTRALLLVAALISFLILPLDSAAAGKMRVAVTKFDNKVKNPSYDPSWDIGEGLAEMLMSELVKTDRFIVLERGAISDVVVEQELGSGGLVRKETAAQTGQMIGAQVIVRGAVTEFSQQVRGAKGGVSAPEFKGGVSTDSSYVALDIRLIDANTSQVIASSSATGTAPATGVSGSLQGPSGSGVVIGGEAFLKTPIGRATREAMSKAVTFILQKAAAQESSLVVVKVEGDRVFINAGTNDKIRVGDVFTVYSQSEDLIDPSTGLNLGKSQGRIGTIEVIDVQEKFSIAAVKNGGGMKRSDVIKRF